jgi:molecular chaperone DnaJ
MTIQTLKDWYAVLEVSPTATHEQVKRAYRQKAFVCHPDRGGSAFRMKAVNEAWAVLGDPELRRQYDAEVREERDRQGREVVRVLVRPIPARAVTKNAPAPPETFVSDLGRMGMVVAFWIGKMIRIVRRRIGRLFK